MNYDVTIEYDRVEANECHNEWARDYNVLYDFTPHPYCRLTRYRDDVLVKWHASLTERVPEWKAFRKATSDTISWQMVNAEYKTAGALMDAISIILIDRGLLPVQKGKAA